MLYIERFLFEMINTYRELGVLCRRLHIFQVCTTVKIEFSYFLKCELYNSQYEHDTDEGLYSPLSNFLSDLLKWCLLIWSLVLIYYIHLYIFCYQLILNKLLIVGSSAPFHLVFGVLRFRTNILHFMKAFRDLNLYYLFILTWIQPEYQNSTDHCFLRLDKRYYHLVKMTFVEIWT